MKRGIAVRVLAVDIDVVAVEQFLAREKNHEPKGGTKSWSNVERKAPDAYSHNLFVSHLCSQVECIAMVV